jgi:hypothetical protein
MKLSIEAELIYNFANATQVIAKLEASRTSDQVILSELLEIQPPAQVISDTGPHGDRWIRASLSGNVAIRYSAVVGEQPQTTASINRSAACVVRLARRRSTVSASQPLLPVRQIHALRATRVRK